MKKFVIEVPSTELFVFNHENEITEFPSDLIVFVYMEKVWHLTTVPSGYAFVPISLMTFPNFKYFSRTANEAIKIALNDKKTVYSVESYQELYDLLKKLKIS